MGTTDDQAGDGGAGCRFYLATISPSARRVDDGGCTDTHADVCLVLGHDFPFIRVRFHFVILQVKILRHSVINSRIFKHLGGFLFTHVEFKAEYARCIRDAEV